MRSDRIGEHESVGWSLVHALEGLSIEHASSLSGVTTSELFRAILTDGPADSYWLGFPAPSDERCPTPFENRFRDLANELCGIDEEITVPKIEKLIDSVLNSWWALLDEGVYRPRDNEFYRFQSKTLQSALRTGSAWFGSLSALRGLLASQCNATRALQQQNLDTEKFGKALRGMEDFGIDSNTPLMELAFDIANNDGGEVAFVGGPRVPRKIGTGHLLLAMLEDKDTRASQLLRKLKIDAGLVDACLASLPPET